MKKKQEIKVGTILELTPAEEMVISSMMKENRTLQSGVRTMVVMHESSVEHMFKVITELFPETKNFYIATDIVKNKVVIHIRSRR